MIPALSFRHHLRVMLLMLLVSSGFSTARAQPTAAEPQRYRIAGITVMGTEYTDPQAIKLFSGLKEGEEILLPGEDIADAIRLLWKQKLFADVSIYAAEFRGTDVYLVIRLTEMPRLGSFGFPGLRKSEAENLREKLALVNGTVCNENLKTTAISRIRKYYVEKGFFNVKIDIRETPDPILQDKNYIRLDFLVERGNRVKVGEIALVGASEISPARVRRFMKNTKQMAWWRIFKSSKYIEEEYATDKAAVIAKYNKEGFRNARIVRDSIYTIAPGRIGIYMKIEEDRRFYFRNISFAGNTKYSGAALDSVLNIRKGDVYNLEMLSQRIEFNQNGRDISSLYTDDGYLSFYAFPVETLVQPDSIDIEIRVYEGNQFRIGRVTVTGNTKTNDHVIFREIRTRPGDLFNRSDVVRTQRELAALNYFNPQAFDVKMNPREDKGLVDLQYVVEEKPSDQIELSGGWGGGRIVGSLGLSFNNFSMRNIFKKDAWTPLPSGDGQRFSIRAVSNGLFFRSYNLSFTEPWLGGRKPNSLSVSAFRSVQTNGLRRRINNEINPAYQSLVINGASVSFGQRWQRPDDWFLFYAGVSYQHFELNRFGSFFSFNEGFSNNLSFNATLERNSVSDPIYPTWGSKITLSTKSTLPYTLIGQRVLGQQYDFENMPDQERFDWVEYYKIKFTANWYTALNKHKTNKFVLHTNVGFGFLGAYNRQLGESPFERFYLGGVFLSGFLLDGREIVNLRGYDDLSLTTPSDRVGAPIITKYGMELRYPLSTNPSATIFALSFLEAGRTWEDFGDYNPFNLYRSGGVGLRIFLPMFGLLGFDYGWRLDELPSRPNMSRGQFHFSIGMNLGEL
ncbi:MAG: outer membrane protein assembly factor [Flavobacteriales bacterium]